MPRRVTKRASYREAVQWIAVNDEPGEKDVEVMQGMISVCLVADIFGADQAVVAKDVMRARERSQS